MGTLLEASDRKAGDSKVPYRVDKMKIFQNWEPYSTAAAQAKPTPVDMTARRALSADEKKKAADAAQSKLQDTASKLQGIAARIDKAIYQVGTECGASFVITDQTPYTIDPTYDITDRVLTLLRK
jgi:Skp family chaperone for outer membrane proteins